MLDWKNKSCCQLGNGLCGILNQCPFWCQLGKAEHFPEGRLPRMSCCIALSSQLRHPMLEGGSLGLRKQRSGRSHLKLSRCTGLLLPQSYRSTENGLGEETLTYGASWKSCRELQGSSFYESSPTLEWVLMMWLHLSGPCSCK